MSKKILLVEDETIIALGESKMLEKYGFKVYIASNFEKAIVEFRNKKIDLVLMDIDLGKHQLNGGDLAKQLLRIKEVPIIFLSSHTDRQTVDQVKEIAGYGYVSKNSGEFVLVESIEMALKLFNSKKKADRNREKYEKLFHNAPIGIFRTISNGNIIEINNGMARIFDFKYVKDFYDYYKNIELIYKNKKDRERLIEVLKQEGSVYSFETQVVTPLGRTKWVAMDVVKNQGNENFVLEGFMRDITDEKKNFDRFKNLFDGMNDGVVVYESIDNGKDFRIIEINKSGEKLSKVKRKNILGKSILEVFPNVKEFGLLNVFQKVYQTGEKHYFPLAKYKDDRIEQWVENTVYKLNTGEIVAIYQDTSDKKIIEKELKENEESLHITLNSIGDGVISTDNKGRIKRMNAMAEKLTGWAENDAIDLDLMEVFRVEDLNGKVFENPIEEVLIKKDVITLKSILLINKDGKKIKISDSIAPILDNKNNIKGLVLVFKEE